MKKRNRLIPGIMWIPIFLALVCNMIAYYGTRLVTTDWIHHDITSFLDEKIPLISWTIVIYFGCYLFWIVNYVIGCRQDQEKAFRFMSADFLAKLVCLLCFLVYPTTNIRPDITGTSLWDELIRFLYRVDAADNLFPSIHCLTSYFCFIAVRNNKKIPRWYQVLSLFITISICLSTLTTKQHVLIDVAAGVLLAEISWLFVDKSGFSRWYANILTKVYRRITDRRLSEQKN